MTPKTPLKSAMRVPGTPARKFENPLSPTFREEDILDQREKHTEKEQAKDLVSFSSSAGPASQLTGADTERRKSKRESGWPSLPCAV